MVTLLRAGPGAEVVDELVAVRSCVHACTDRSPMREVGILGRTRSDCILLFDLDDFLLARLRSEPSEARKLWPWHDEMAGPLHSACLGPGLLFSSLSLATTCSLMVYHCQAMLMDTPALSTGCGIDRGIGRRIAVR
jgi:hypothetical protein